MVFQNRFVVFWHTNKKMLTEKKLRKLGFTTVGDELGEDGALEIYINNDDYSPVLVWIPDVEGHYIDKEVSKGLHIVIEHTAWLQLPHVKTVKQVQDLYFLIANKKLKELKEVTRYVTHKITTLE